MWQTKLVEARQRQGMNQGALASRLGIAQSSVARWENGVNMPSFEQLLKIRTILDVSLDWLFDDARTEPYDVERDCRRAIADVGGPEVVRRRLLGVPPIEGEYLGTVKAAPNTQDQDRAARQRDAEKQTRRRRHA